MANFECNFISYSLQRAVTFSIIVPSMTCPEWVVFDPDFLKLVDPKTMPARAEKLTHRRENKMPVLYLLHGTANDYSTWLRYTTIERMAEERNICVVTFSAENKSYIDRNNGDAFWRFVSEELPNFVCANFNVSQRPEDTYIAGLSMGGYGTLVHALGNPQRYCAFGAFSSGINRLNMKLSKRSDIAESNIDLYELAEKQCEKGVVFPKGMMAVGEKDPYFAPNRAFYDFLKKKGVDVFFESDPAYGHEWDFWEQEIRRFLDWIPRTDAYAAQGKRRI